MVEQQAECRVCPRGAKKRFYEDQGRLYWSCDVCWAVFVDEKHLPGPVEERRRYLEHENDPADQGYRRFLNRLARPLLQMMPPNLNGLDYGCGPGPALALMLEEAGHRVTLYDPFFYPGKDRLEQEFDFIVCTETAEHFHRPWMEFIFLNRMLRSGGWLGIMTVFVADQKNFPGWYYRRDPTHVTFYSRRTFHVLAEILGWRCEIPAPNVVIMHKD